MGIPNCNKQKLNYRSFSLYTVVVNGVTDLNSFVDKTRTILIINHKLPHIVIYLRIMY